MVFSAVFSSVGVKRYSNLYLDPWVPCNEAVNLVAAKAPIAAGLTMEVTCKQSDLFLCWRMVCNLFKEDPLYN